MEIEQDEVVSLTEPLNKNKEIELNQIECNFFIYNKYFNDFFLQKLKLWKSNKIKRNIKKMIVKLRRKNKII